MNKLTIAVMLVLFGISSSSWATDYTPTDQLYGWDTSGGTQFWQTWSAHILQLQNDLTFTLNTDNQTALEVPVTATSFDGNLAVTDTDVQKVAQKLDDLIVTGGSALTVIDESTTLSTETSQITFAGTGVTATEPSADGEILVTVAAGAAPIDTVFGRTGTVVATTDDYNADQIDDSSTTNKFTTSADISKLSGIEAGATADQDLSNLLTTAHTTTHPAPTVRDARNQVAGSYEPLIGNPSVTGYVPSRSTDGTWTWVVNGSGVGDDLGSATYSSVVALWASCTDGYLKFDGSCDSPSGTGSLPTVKYVRQSDSGTADGSSYANAWGVDSVDYAAIAELGTLYICGEIQGSIVPTKGLHISGACPGYPGILNGSVDYVGSTWTEDGTNLWYIANSDIVYDGMFALFGAETQSNVGTHQTSLVALTSQGDFYNDHTLNRFWIYSTTNPSTAYTQILVPTDTDKYAISATGVDNLTITDLTFQYYGQNAIRLVDCNNVEVLNNTLKYGGGNQADGGIGYGGGGMVFHGDFIGLNVLHNSIFQNHDAAIGPHNYEADKVARDITIGYNDISYCGGGISTHTNVSATNSVVSDVTIKNNTLSNIGDGWSGLLASAEGRGIKTNNTAASVGGVMEQVIISDNTIAGAYWRGIQLFNISGDENEISSNIVTGIKNSASGDGGSIEIDGSTNNCAGEVFSNTVYDNEQHGLLIENNAAIVNVFDNVFYNNGSVTQENVRFQNSSLNTFNDNVVYSADNVAIRDAGPYFVGDNNQYWRDSVGDTYQHGAVLSDDIATWRTATGQDANGSDDEPVFSAPSRDSFVLLEALSGGVTSGTGGLDQAGIEALAALDLSNVSLTLHESNALDTEITYENLATNGDVGTGSTQVAQGNHSHNLVDMADWPTGLTLTELGHLSDVTSALQAQIDDLQSQIDNIDTGTPADTTPDAFSFTDQTGVAVSTTITSAAITVAGIDASTAISSTGGTFDINASDTFVSSSNVVNGDTVRARHTSSASNSAGTDTVVTIGGVSDTFTSTTTSGAGVTEITLVDSSTALATSTTITIDVPTTATDGQLILSVVNDDNGTITTPTGWTLLDNETASSSAQYVFVRDVTGNEPTSYTITNSGSTGLVAVMTSWQMPSGGTWTNTAQTRAFTSQTVVYAGEFSAPDNSVVYMAFPNDGGFAITGGPYDGYQGTTAAPNVMAIARAVENSTISVDTYYEPFTTAADEYRNVVFSGSEDSAVISVVMSYE